MSGNGKIRANMPDGVTAVKAEYLPINAEWLRPAGSDESKAILYFHGGGFAMSNVESHRSIIGNFANMVGYKTLLFDYRFDSEFHAPAAVIDSAAIYLWMLEQGYHPKDIIFAGDSAGAGIELRTLVKLRDDGIPMPAACVAFSPSLNITITDESHKIHPDISPLYADLTGLPPIMIHVGKNEVLRDDVTSFGARADFFGVDVRVKVWKGREEATESMKQVGSFIKHNLQKDSDISATYLHMMMLFSL